MDRVEQHKQIKQNIWNRIERKKLGKNRIKQIRSVQNETNEIDRQVETEQNKTHRQMYRIGQDKNGADR